VVTIETQTCVFVEENKTIAEAITGLTLIGRRVFRILTEVPPILTKPFIRCFVLSLVGMVQNACTLPAIKFHRNPLDI
jgi:hypothetical protein